MRDATKIYTDDQAETLRAVASERDRLLAQVATLRQALKPFVERTSVRRVDADDFKRAKRAYHRTPLTDRQKFDLEHALGKRFHEIINRDLDENSRFRRVAVGYGDYFARVFLEASKDLTGI